MLDRVIYFLFRNYKIVIFYHKSNSYSFDYQKNSYFILHLPQMRSAVSSRNTCHPRQRKRGDHEAKRNGGVERSETVPEESSRRSEAIGQKNRGWPLSQIEVNFDFLVILFCWHRALLVATRGRKVLILPHFTAFQAFRGTKSRLQPRSSATMNTKYTLQASNAAKYP